MRPQNRRWLRNLGFPLAIAVVAGVVVILVRRGKHVASDASQGQAVFQRRCALCHGTGSEPGQGPGLGDVVGRRAATGPRFTYTAALQGSGLTWDAATLERFLAAPTETVPGTRMLAGVADPEDRRLLVAYLSTLHAASTLPAAQGRKAGRPPIATPGLRTGAAAFGDFSGDGPGVRRHITVADLPAPFATPAVSNGSSLVRRPDDMHPILPPGFTASDFAEGLENPRLLRVAPNGDVFVAEMSAGRVRVLWAKDGATKAEDAQVFAGDLERPFGIAFYPPGPRPGWVYVAENNRVVRFPYQSGDRAARGAAEVIVPRLPENGHETRDLVFSKDGARMFVSVGSESNVAEGMPKRGGAEIRSWEAAHGLGASWDSEARRADVLVFDPEGKGEKSFANGIRNCVGMVVSPVTGDLWCGTNERDGLGDNLVPDYVTRVREGAFYGWPWYYLGDHEDPRHAGERPDLAGRMTLPDVLLEAHSAALQLAFYDGAMFPAEYRGDAFVALHGSWNRASRTGYKVVRLPVHDGVPTGEYEDFLTGLVVDEDQVWARPVGVAVAHDGALLVSEDGNGTVWRIAYHE